MVNVDSAEAPDPFVKPVPPELFAVHEANAEMRWEALAGVGDLVPIDRFFVRNHTRTPVLDASSWRLRVFGTGLRGRPSIERAVEFTYDQLRALPSTTITAYLECAGNGRNFFATQQNQPAPSAQWKLGGIGVARWRGARLADVLELAGLADDAVDVMPQGLDPEWVNESVNLGRVRRPLPVAKALEDVLLAYEMNDQPLPHDHGYPVRVIVPNWVGIASIKWVGQIEVANTPLLSPWNTQFYRVIEPSSPSGGVPAAAQVVKSAFEMAWNGTVTAGRENLLRGRSWSGHGAIAKVEVSTDGGIEWRNAEKLGETLATSWQRWETRWTPPSPGPYTLMARATDTTGAGQPERASFNTLGYLYDGVVKHPVIAV